MQGKNLQRLLRWANVTGKELAQKQEIPTPFGETLLWKYLCYARENAVEREIPDCILYGEEDTLISEADIKEFADRTGASLTVMKDGEHWFHTER